MLLVQSDGLLDGVVADHVSLGEVFGEDAGTGLVFLVDGVFLRFFRFAGRGRGGGGGGGFFACELIDGGGA